MTNICVPFGYPRLCFRVVNSKLTVLNFHFYLVFVTKVAAMFGFLSKETVPYPLKKEGEGGDSSCPLLFVGGVCLFVVLWFCLGVVWFFL